MRLIRSVKCVILYGSVSSGFVSRFSNRRPTLALDALLEDRRQVLASFFWGSSFVAINDPENLTSQLFNADGSLKDSSTKAEAKFRTVSLQWKKDGEADIAVDGKFTNNRDDESKSDLRISYDLPEKWDSKYVENGKSALQKITVYRKDGNMDLLSKAAEKGVIQTLNLGDTVGVQKADLIGGRTRKDNNGDSYYEFDMGVAPITCTDSPEDLGLGFCPYDTIYLVSATAASSGDLYVMVLQATKYEWKRASADLRRVRSSFRVELAA